MSREQTITPIDADALQQRLRHVFWIGGGSGAGKSTVARRIADACGLHYYATDDAMPDHGKRSTPKDSPLLHAFMAMDMDERWVNRSPAAMLETFHWFQGEGFAMIVEDLLRLPTAPGVIVEGFRLLPRLVQPLLAAPRQAAWLLPVPAFRAAVFAGRGGPQWGFIANTSDPDRALHNLLARDAMFTEQLRDEALRLAVNVVSVDSTLTVDGLTRRVMEQFGLDGSRGFQRS